MVEITIYTETHQAAVRFPIPKQDPPKPLIVERTVKQ